VTEKVCCRCQQSKLLDYFFRDKKAADGRQSWCIQCKKEYEQIAKGKKAREKARGNYLVKNLIKERARKKAQKKICLVDCTCQYCNGEAQHRHHVNYDDPLDVVPVCTRCHANLHYGVNQ
jgi:hypothetical protein